MLTIKSRLAALQEYRNEQKPSMTRFITDDGKTFCTELGAFEYLYKHGAYTPNGQRLVSYIHPHEDVDPLSMSLYELIDEAVTVEFLNLPEANYTTPPYHRTETSRA